WLRDLMRESRWFRIALQTAAGAVVLGLVAAGAWAWYQSQESRGLVALAEAGPLVQQASAPDAPIDVRTRGIKVLESLIADSPRLSTLPQATYQLGNLKYLMGQHEAARGAYELTLAKGASGSLAALAGM